MNHPPRDSNDRDTSRRDSPSIDETLKALEDPFRRDVIKCCVSSPDQIFDVHELADAIVSAREELEEEVDREGLLLALHHHHLPLLAESGVIDFDPQGGQLRYKSDELVERWVRRIRAEEPD